MRITVALLFGIMLIAPQANAQEKRATATDLVDRAIARMGGEAALKGVERIQYDYVTMWGRFNTDARPFMDAGGYEQNLELRDYSANAWRNLRRSAGPGQWFEIRDIVIDSVGGRFLPSRNTWTPLNTAYLDERKELFTYTPDRLMLLAKASKDLKRGPDTLLGGMPHTRVTGTINGYPSTIFFRKTDDLPGMFRFRAAQEADFGLTQWGEMEPEVWYSRWSTLENKMSVPMQWDIKRVGQHYKRISILGAKVNLPIAADSFAIPDTTRAAFLTRERRAMHDVSYSATKLVESDFATFPQASGNYGAVRVGNGWVLLESGQAPENAERAVEWIKKNGNGNVVAAVLGMTQQANGGVVWLTANKIPVHVAPLAAPIVDIILRNRNRPATGYNVVNKGMWIRNGGDSLWVEPVDLPNARGTLFVYSPRLKWLWSPYAGNPFDYSFLRGIVSDRNWVVERVGSLRGVMTPAP